MLRLLRNQKTNRANSDNPCLYCLKDGPNKWDFFEVFMIRILTFSDGIFKESWFSVFYDYI